jgi:3-dehydroquinate synthase
MNRSNTTICNNFVLELNQAIGNQSADSIFVLADDNTHLYCLPLVLTSEKLSACQIITIPSGDEHKTIQTAIQIWEFLSSHGATRKSLMINVGGGMISDIGGFTASTFKRGIRYINVSTTLLGAVDAATGGKTGINFGGLKNEIGVFAPADAVLINIDFFKTLDAENLRSGFAEMLKHGLIDTRSEWEHITAFDLEKLDLEELRPRLQKSFTIKERIVKEDPHEKGIRKALNLGHTFGHAFESYSYKIGQPVLHGYAVAWGLLCELFLSKRKLGFPENDLKKLTELIIKYYGLFNISPDDYETLIELMTHDKKNESKKINFTLLKNVGEIQINHTATNSEIIACFDWYSKL